MTTLACLHGFMGAADDWDEVCELLPEYDVVGLDIEPAETWQAGIDSIYEQLPQESVLVGYSMGARLAIACALLSPEAFASSFNHDPGSARGERGVERPAKPPTRAPRQSPSNLRNEDGECSPTASSGSRLNDDHPKCGTKKQNPKVAALVFVSGCPGLSEAERPGRWNHDQQVATRLDTQVRSDFLESWYRQPVFSSLPPRLVQEEIQRKLDRDGSHWARLLRTFSVGLQPDFWPQLSEFEIPVLAVAGQHDSKYAEIANHLGKVCPNCRVEVVPGAGHMVHREQPETFAHLLRDFVSTITHYPTRNRDE